MGEIYTLFIIDEHYNKLHRRTAHASNSAHQTAEKNQKISIDTETKLIALKS